MAENGTLGIDAGTQGLSVVFVATDDRVLATGDGAYEMVPGLGDGCYEQSPSDWESALKIAMQDLRSKLNAAGIDSLEVNAIGITGQMHGEVLIDADGNSVGNARLWCDARNDAEGDELTDLFGAKIPKRMTVARWLWTTRNETDKAGRAARMTTPAGWIAYRLTGEHRLGIGDASGMFPIDQSTLDYDSNMLQKFEAKFSGPVKLSAMLPQVAKAGEDGGSLSDAGAELLGLPSGIPVSPAEGDQPAALAGSLIAEPGMVSASFGTSVCANSVGDRAFQGVSPAVDHFCAVDGRPINMVFLRNGTTFMNTIVNMFAENSKLDFGGLMQTVLSAAPDCGGVLALPFMDDEPGLGVNESGKSGIFGLSVENSKPGDAIKATLLATMFNLKSGLSVLDEQGYPRSEIVLTGGLTKTPELGQVLADVLQTPVTLPAAADEGTAFGAALMAKFRLHKITGEGTTWAEFLKSKQRPGARKFDSDETTDEAYTTHQARYDELVKTFTN